VVLPGRPQVPAGQVPDFLRSLDRDFAIELIAAFVLFFAEDSTTASLLDAVG
jgi:hypothetical protein